MCLVDGRYRWWIACVGGGWHHGWKACYGSEWLVSAVNALCMVDPLCRRCRRKRSFHSVSLYDFCFFLEEGFLSRWSVWSVDGRYGLGMAGIDGGGQVSAGDGIVGGWLGSAVDALCMVDPLCRRCTRKMFLSGRRRILGAEMRKIIIKCGTIFSAFVIKVY